MRRFGLTEPLALDDEFLMEMFDDNRIRPAGMELSEEFVKICKDRLGCDVDPVMVARFLLK